MIETIDSDYTVVINVCTAIRNKNTDEAAEEIAHYRDHCKRAERERVLADIHAWLDPMPDTQELQMLAEFLYALEAVS